MYSESPHVAAQLRNLIYYALDNDILQTALFHAGRLHGLDGRSGDAAHLIALCHFRLGQYKAAYDYSRERGLRGVHLGCAYVFAQACLALGRAMEGVTALERAKGFWTTRNHWNKHGETTRRHVPDAAAVSFLLGKLWLSYGETTKGVECMLEALKINPFLWEAFAELCNTGARIKAHNIFKMTPEMLEPLQEITLNGFMTPDRGSVYNDETPEAQKESGREEGHKRTISGQMADAPQRRSDRLLRSRLLPGNRLARDPGRDLKKRATGTKGTMRTGRMPLASETVRKPEPRDALTFLLEQYGKLGQGYLALCRYDATAVSTFESLTPQIRETPWVLAQIGRAHFERSAYAEAEQTFSKIRKLAPSRTEDMEVYSTVLWHLKKDVHLSYLSHQLIETDRLSPQAWCALGNAFSLQGEHDQAVKCFRRATQLDPKFAYAFTLAGHEHVANEEFEKALFSFRSAITADQRHYNGWYGLGRVFEKLGKYEIARDHYINAAKINPTNPVLKVCIGLVLEKTCVGIFPEKQRRRELALEMYHEACEQDPRSAKARFAKARLLLILHRPEEAFGELDVLKNMMPDDADVHFLLGRVYKALRDTTAALRHFTIAMNLDPKATNLIKESLETLEDSDEDYDDDD